MFHWNFITYMPIVACIKFKEINVKVIDYKLQKEYILQFVWNVWARLTPAKAVPSVAVHYATAAMISC